MSSSFKTPAVVNLDRIRAAQSQRIESSLASWEQAKEELRLAITLVETREREFHEISADVDVKLAAVDTVLRMAGVEPEQETETPPEPAAEPGLRRLFSRSRSLVPQENRAALVAASA
jgi:hypothetical protein